MGHVLQANCGQHSARQASIGAGIPTSVPCTTVNKICASGMKAIMLGAQAIRCGDQDVVVAGGMESMSNAPYYLARGETPYGGITLKDGIIVDGLTDVYNAKHMGECAENLAKKFNITREQQDDFAKQSYSRSASAIKKGIFSSEIVPVTIPGKRGKPDLVVNEDEEVNKANFEKFATLNPVFIRNGGTITAANASSLNDGAAACVLVSQKFLDSHDLKPLAKVISYADAAVEPIDFGIAPAYAIPKVNCLKNTLK